ncbi:hypothetical protein GTY48_25900 [Bacillus thuringiensis]|uniref:Uncharacterized protein n=2 Tax=Bacillus cereus group TaxID=86661 RepID=A0AB34DG40_BACCE|nr:hypothetical protein DN401_09920 [Bacillus sp. BF2-3]KAB2368767.1 hypothetical protein F8517_08650 [Bacillus thuringiensis]KAB2501736.1 hypothetical protein F8158_02500 [Bacillus cereus]QCX97399.1 hypothetical protein EJ379_21825 [Bacillus cereus ATCC 14579]QGY38435.1 hypothetical protein GD442_20935 [Bacillus sp. A260]RKN64049.1 hypothetical protein D7H67_02835 [Bacillus sp. S66]TKV47615.1 hypothetical protein C1I58_14840 [Bacillus sp. PIC28]TXR74885.1 hypothetical protein DN400_14525 [B
MISHHLLSFLLIQ